jgi:branched-chain amino acid transport system ATP-binding protein
MLRVEHVSVQYGAITAIRDISFDVAEGEIVTLLGANGAGKSSTLRMLSGLVTVASGRIEFDGDDVTRLPAHEFVTRGLSHVPEGRRIFPVMTVVENLEMGAFRNGGVLADDLDRMYSLFPILGRRRKQLGGTLSGGEQQMLAIARALMSHPKLLLLDEPSMGLAPMIVEEIFHIIQEIRREGTTVLLVEQNAAQALALADRGYVLENGVISFGDRASTLLGDARIRAAYLGEAE